MVSRSSSLVARSYRRLLAAMHVLLYGNPPSDATGNATLAPKQAVPPKLQLGSKTAPRLSESDLEKLKQSFGYPFKLNLGCGDEDHLGQDYIHIDIRSSPITDMVAPVESTGLPDQSCCVIIAWNVLEHVSWRQTQATLQHWFDLLQPNGRLALSTPNLEKLAYDVLEADSVVYTKRQDRGGHIIEHLYGGQDYDGNYHVAGWKPSWLAEELERVGFRVEAIGDGNLKDFGFPFNKPAGVLPGANGWDMLAIATRPSA